MSWTTWGLVAGNITKARFIRRISAVSNAIETKDIEANHLIIYYFNCIRRDKNSTFETGQSRLDELEYGLNGGVKQGRLD